MRTSYERYLDEDRTPELSYEECLQIVKGLEAVRKYSLSNSPIVEKVAILMQQSRFRNLAWLNQLIENTAVRMPGDSKGSSVNAGHPKTVSH